MNIENSKQNGDFKSPFAVEIKNINKSFGPVQANKEISLNVSGGTIHGIIGENGAGKSTLMSILYGFYQPDSGEIKVHGKLAYFKLLENLMLFRLKISKMVRTFSKSLKKC